MLIGRTAESSGFSGTGISTCLAESFIISSMQSSTATIGSLTGSGSPQSQSSCAPARRSDSLAVFVSTGQPAISASESAFIHQSPGKFSVASTTTALSFHRNQQYSVIALTDDNGDAPEGFDAESCTTSASRVRTRRLASFSEGCLVTRCRWLATEFTSVGCLVAVTSRFSFQTPATTE